MSRARRTSFSLLPLLKILLFQHLQHLLPLFFRPSIYCCSDLLHSSGFGAVSCYVSLLSAVEARHHSDWLPSSLVNRHGLWSPCGWGGEWLKNSLILWSIGHFLDSWSLPHLRFYGPLPHRLVFAQVAIKTEGHMTSTGHILLGWFPVHKSVPPLV